MNDIVTAERIAVLESQVEYFNSQLILDRAERKQELSELSDKIDTLLSLKERGAGAFWLFGIIFGSGIIAAVTSIVTWFKGG